MFYSAVTFAFVFSTKKRQEILLQSVENAATQTERRQSVWHHQCNDTASARFLTGTAGWATDGGSALGGSQVSKRSSGWSGHGGQTGVVALDAKLEYRNLGAAAEVLEGPLLSFSPDFVFSICSSIFVLLSCKLAITHFCQWLFTSLSHKNQASVCLGLLSSRQWRRFS